MNNFVKVIQGFISNSLMCKDTVIKILLAQDKILFNLTGIWYINKEDIKSIDKLDEEEIDDFLSTLKDAILEEDLVDDNLSPWCNLYDCDDCPYGRNHEQCNEDDSTHKKIMAELDDKHGIDEISEIEDITTEIKKILGID